MIMLHDLLTSLPESLSCCVLRDWLNFKSVMALNSAFCCISSREMFLKLLQSDEYVIRDEVIIASHSNILNMVHVLGRKIRSILFMDRLNHAQRKIVAANCTNLTHISYASAVKMKLRTVLRANPDIEHLELSPIDYQFREKSVVPSFHKVSLPNLRSLAVRRHMDLDGQILNAISHGKLVQLDLSYSVIHFPTFLTIARVVSPYLRSCGLLQTGMSDAILIEFTRLCPNIAHLDISHNDRVTDTGILGVVLNLRGLRSLCISHMESTTDASLVHIYTYCADTLHTLHLHTQDDGFLQDEAEINVLLERCIHMRVLHLSVPCVFTRNAICNLTTLVLVGDDLCADNLATIGQCCSHLEVLFLDGFRILTTQGLVDICLNCTQLKKLYLDLTYMFYFKPRDDQDTLELAKLALELWKELKFCITMSWLWNEV